MINVGILCYSLTPSTVDLIERIIEDNYKEINVTVFPLVFTELHSDPSFLYVKPDRNTRFFSLGKNKEENQIVKLSFMKMFKIVSTSDIIISFGVQSMPCLILSFFCKLYKKEFFLVHQTMSLFGERFKKNKFVRFLKSIAIKNATAHIAQTPCSREVLEKVYSVSSGQIFDAFWDGGLSSLKELTDVKPFDNSASNNSVLNVIFVGSLIPLKNVEVILRALSLLPNNYNFNLNIVGHDHQYPGEENRLKALCSNLKIQEKVCFRGRLQFDDIARLYVESDIIVLPSIKEAWAKVLVEAAYYYTALITTKVNGQAGYLVEDQITGYVLDCHDDAEALADCFIKLYNDRTLLQKMKLEARRYVDTFSSQEMEMSGFKKIFVEYSR